LNEIPNALRDNKAQPIRAVLRRLVQSRGNFIGTCLTRGAHARKVRIHAADELVITTT